MPSLTYIGEPDRVYPSLGLAPTPGESYDVAEDPQDGRWGAVSTTPAPTPPAPAPVAPTPSVTSEPTTTTED
jgi:hypothetical protein